MTEIEEAMKLLEIAQELDHVSLTLKNQRGVSSSDDSQLSIFNIVKQALKDHAVKRLVYLNENGRL